MAVKNTQVEPAKKPRKAGKPYLSFRADEAWVAFVEDFASQIGLSKSSFTRMAVNNEIITIAARRNEPGIIERLKELQTKIKDEDEPEAKVEEED